MNDATVNTQNKDRLFKKIFGSEDHRAWTLSLYNAVNGSNYTDPDKIEYNTIDDFLYLGYHNDVSFIIGETVNLYEHQSTYNPNLPLRFLIYVGKIYAKYVSAENNSIDIYRRKREIIPVPKFICFYNGSEKRPETEVMRFSDLLPPGSRSDIEITVNVLNINPEYNARLLEACQALKEYSLFTAAIRKNVYSKGMHDGCNIVIFLDLSAI